jgi:hypothetical protein
VLLAGSVPVGWARWRGVGAALPGAALAASICLTPGYAYQARGGWRDLVEAMASNERGVKPGDAIVFHSGGTNDWKPFAMFFCFSYYAPESYRESHPFVVMRGLGEVEGEAGSVLEKAGRAWVLTARPVGMATPELRPGWKEEAVISVAMPPASGTPASVRVMRK